MCSAVTRALTSCWVLKGFLPASLLTADARKGSPCALITKRVWSRISSAHQATVMQSVQNSLADELARSLPASVELKYHHISVPPTRCTDIYSPPPGCSPRKTYSESHSLLVSITPPGASADAHVAIFAIELILYSTAELSTLFISKADSTGFVSLLHLPHEFGSLLRVIASTFISWLVRCRHRPDRRLVLSLFARAQGQYLFPGSVENSSKHVLDDRMLVKWWCKTLDPIIKEYALEGSNDREIESSLPIVSKAYLIVPGHDKYETTAFFPPTESNEEPNRKRWVNDHPLRQISSNPTAPPRCLVPHFPDDPKSRFLDDLDEELPDSTASQQGKLESPSKRGIGQWKSVRSLEQFWEMMAFRQECSSGRLVGFIWIVFSPTNLENYPQRADRSVSPSPTRRKVYGSQNVLQTTRQTPVESQKDHLSGPIYARAPRVKGAHGPCRPVRQRSEITNSYYSPLRTRGTLVLNQKAYERVHQILLRLDFTGLETASASTAKWVLETAVIAGSGKVDWGVNITGLKPNPQLKTGHCKSGISEINELSVKKRKRTTGSGEGMRVPSRDNILVANESKTQETAVQISTGQVTPAVNVLGHGLVRKKAKPNG